MCTVCGCGPGETRVEGADKAKPKRDGDHRHTGDQSLRNGSDHHHHYGTGEAGASVPGMSQSRMIQLEQDILSKNNSYANANRRHFAERAIFALNLVSSPGSGKTTLLVETLKRLSKSRHCYVVEGDQQTSNDADRIRETGVTAVQINTGKGCHLDGHMVGHAIEHMSPCDGSLIFIENVGNLVCPAAFDLGEAHKVVILSVTEGEDKPIKYPDMFAAADLMLLNKSDLLPHLDFDVEAAKENALRVNPNITILTVSARTGEGFDHWLTWIKAARTMKLAGHPVLGAAE
ncbi:hydrogenase nickel incorporation protein HypB [Roseibium porphyridii]|uniref:Hydrogenase maturation factor HypB n=1 Tax=Roseibium porphyridii TaxID=2866279 RepID=A0ABY8FBK7_9HYPH|nr:MULTISPECIES: hydrogenase nickel incorporation protein HypB [Stappiaceae]QFT29014.1 Hydrogenase isoenzymes nickel incorporation protein HypB [Labrenzia sp. THAF82]WFE90018.1 hydrogenase nickel incorporation protein HypB [Roseibium sp. KMA01]